MNQESLCNLKIVTQPPGSYVCAVACASMLTGVPIETLLQEHSFDTTDGGSVYWEMGRMFSVLARHGWQGVFVRVEGDVLDSVPLRPKKYVSLVAVESEALKLTDGSPAHHLVVWNPFTKEVFDPHYSTPRELHDYTVVEWNPLVKVLPYDGPPLDESP